jgi:hypothetical protein
VKKANLFIQSALVLAMAAPMLASAESDISVVAAPAAISAAARLDFRVVIPRVLYLAVGTGSTVLADNAAVDDVTFDYTLNPAAIGTGAPATTITGNVVPVRVLGNNGVIALTSTNTGALSNGAGDSIAWSEITAVSSDAANFASPAPAGASVNLGLNAGSTKVTDRTANWTFSFANTAVVAPGTYGSTDGTQNGRVTYTASMP